jgi:hypothetical protein
MYYNGWRKIIEGSMELQTWIVKSKRQRRPCKENAEAGKRSRLLKARRRVRIRALFSVNGSFVTIAWRV